MVIYKIYRGVEQMEARWAHNPKAVGSSPTPATNRKRSLVKRLLLFFSNKLTFQVDSVFNNVFQL